MSFCYSFKKDDLAFDQWEEKVDELVGEEGGAFEEMQLSQMIRMSQDADEEFGFRCMVKGSIRGVLVREADDEIEVLVNTFASRADQYLAARLAWEAIAMGATVEKEGHGPISQDDLGGDQIEQAHQEWFSLSRRSAATCEGNITMPINGLYSISLSRDDAQMENEALEQALIERIAPFGDAFPSTRMRLGVGDSPDGAIASVAQEEMPSLVQKDTDLLIVDDHLIPLDAFISHTGAQAIDGQDSWLLPPLNQLPADLRKSLAEHAIDPNAASSGSGDGPSEEEWGVIAQAPVVAFLIVAAADGNVDKKEAIKFSEVLGSLAAQQEHESLSKMMVLAAQNFQQIMPNLMSGNFDPAAMLQEFRQIVETRFSEDEAMMMKTSLLVVGHKVAESSGGFLGLGSKISKVEKKALMALAHLLGIQL